MNWLHSFFGFLIGLLLCDLVLVHHAYREFPNNRKRRFPFSGLWMFWTGFRLLRLLRTRLYTIHLLASKFPLTTSHNNVTREFVQVVRDASLLRSFVPMASGPLVEETGTKDAGGGKPLIHLSSEVSEK